MKERDIADQTYGWLASQCHAKSGCHYAIDAVRTTVRDDRYVIAVRPKPFDIAHWHRRGKHKRAAAGHRSDTGLGNRDFAWLGSVGDQSVDGHSRNAVSI